SGYEDVKRHISAFINDVGDLTPGYVIYQDIKTATDQRKIAEVVFDNAYVETYRTDMAYLSAYLANFYNSYVTSSPLIVDSVMVDQYDPLTSRCISKTTAIRRYPLPFDQDTIGTPTSRYNFKWSYKTFYQIRSIERNKDYTTAADMLNMRDITNQYDFGSGTAIQRYFTTVEYIQRTYIGPFQTKFLNLNTIGDLLEEQGSLESPEEGSEYVVSDTGQQNSMRGNIY
ncbi:MAG TPA: hypothetical protein DF712_07735, partial [Balneola sp.]|nr:hypothetical protein [Balneola sp.]